MKQNDQYDFISSDSQTLSESLPFFRRMQRELSVLFFCLLMMLSLAGCAPAAITPKSLGTLRIPYTETTESKILAVMLRQVLEEEGIPAETVECGSYKDVYPGIMGGTLDLYVDLSSRAWREVLEKHSLYDYQDLRTLRQEYEDMGLYWQPIPKLTGVYTVAVRTNIAEQYDLVTLSDLAEVADQLRLGTDTTWFERMDGFPLLEESYGLSFKSTSSMPENIQYDKIKEKEIDVMPIRTTDGRLYPGKIVTLVDDLDVLPEYSAGIVIRDEVLEAYPGLNMKLYKRLRRMTADDLKEVSAMVTINGTSLESAANFLVERAEGRIGK